MEQKAKKYEELTKYERAMTNASLEQRLEAMAKELEQIGLVLKMSIHINTTVCEADGEVRHSVDVNFFPRSHKVVGRDIENPGDLFGIIEEAIAEKSDELIES